METIVACKMIEQEVQEAMARAGNTSPVIYLDRGLHEDPGLLKAQIQKTLEDIRTRYVLLAYGLCGNAMDGMVSPHSTLVIPRYHDCIQMLVAKDEEGRPGVCPDCLYYTDGWFESDRTMLRQYKEFAERKGEAKARRAYQIMLKNYRHLCLIDTLEGMRPSTLKMAGETGRLFHLKLRKEKGSLSVLEDLFARRWDEQFIICEPGQAVSQTDFLSGGPTVFPSGLCPGNP